MGYMDEYNKLKKKRLEAEAKTTGKATNSGGSSYLNEYNRLRGQSSITTPLNSFTRQPISLVKKDKDEEKKKEKEAKDDSKLDFFQKGALGDIDLGKRWEDGYQFGDVLKTTGDTALNVGKAILGTAGDLGLGLAKGFAKVSEGAADAVANYIIAPVTDVFGADEFADRVREGADINMVDDFTAPAT